MNAAEFDVAEARRQWLPLARHLASLKRPGPALVVGVHGMPGAGKTTSARLLSELLPAARPGSRVETVSIDDLYHTADERRRLGLGWGIGAHDLSFSARLSALKSAGPGAAVALPRFDKAIRDRDPMPRVILGPVDFVVFEGFGVGLTSRGYGAFSSLVDCLVALRCSSAASEAWRREAGWADRREACGGDRAAYDAEFDALWTHVRGQFPWVCAEVESRADLFVDVGEGHRVDGFTPRG